MNETSVRISKIEISGFKNTQYGQIEMPSAIEKDYFSSSADILGIYGQNGSGKTAVVEAMALLQILLTGKSLPKETGHFISEDMDSLKIGVTFMIQTAHKSATIDYTVILGKLPDREIEITNETLTAALWNGEKFESRKSLIDYCSSSKGPVFTPKYRFDQLVKSNEENKINLNVAKKLAQKNMVSFLFGSEGRNIFLSAPDEISEEYAYIIKALHQYASYNLFVITNAHSGSISMNFMLPFAFRLRVGKKVEKGELPIRLDGPSIITKEQYHIVSQIIEDMNAVISAMIPGLSIGIHNFGEQLQENGTEGNKIELISKRDDIIIPLKYESEGIIKIISVLNVLMCIYNHPSMCLIIDELDAGIYEFLLGELLSVMEKGAKGQLIFTSHNLRALEMLHRKSIVFSTTNPANRYIRLQNVKNSNNLRDLYLRSITLGGQKEEVYSETDTVEIGRAFRRAGKGVFHDIQK
jgi:AAA15 family ATPase/GTPase